jgi:predicted Fe-S protein YdhL (DUF1289 family)
MAPAGPMSPCINVCSLDERKLCRGCYRSLEEIEAWSYMTPEQQWAVLRASERRRQSQPQVAAG